MMQNVPKITPTLFSRLPEMLHNKGEPSNWAKMTRPGQPMHSFLEAAFFGPGENLWLTDVPNGRVFRVSPSGDWEVVHQIKGEPHAMRISPEGRHIAVDYTHGLTHLTGPNSFEILSTGLPDQPFLGLSDMAYSPDGALWFTDSGRTSLSDPKGRVYCMAANGDLRLVLDNVPYANGIALSPDGAFIYVAATRANQIWRFASALPNDSPPMVGVFAHLAGGLGPDGLATNDKGWLAVAQAQAGRAYVFDAMGDLLADIRLPKGLWTTSVTFHPEIENRLYIIDAQNGAIFTADLPHYRSYQ